MRLVTAPVSEPVSLAEAKAHLRLEHAFDDDYVTALIKGARQWTEKVCWRGIVTQTWEVVLEEFPTYEGIIRLPKGNLQSVASVKYLDANGAEQTFSAGDYEVDAASVPGVVRLGYFKSWPSSVRTIWNAVVVRYVVGWEPADIPSPLKQAILLLVSQMYEHRTPEIAGTIVSSVSFAADALMAPYRLRRFY